MNFRRYHTLKILEQYQGSKLPIDALLRHYFRANKAVGSKDRKEICEKLYFLIRNMGLIDYQLAKPITWEKRLDAVEMGDLDPKDAPDHVQVSCPKDLFALLKNNYGLEEALSLCQVLNETAPVTIRANLMKTTREKLYAKLNKKFNLSPDANTPTALTVAKKENFFALPEFKEGLFEVQDSGSQHLASLVAAKPGDHILDFCAGSGGKTLAFAPAMKGKGQIYLSDIRPHALKAAKVRLKRAGVQNAQILTKDKLGRKALLSKMDWILLDVPCSGTGTLRRNPDLKWRFSLEMLERLICEQRKIVSEALPFLKKGGHIVYATCSLLKEENEEQLAYFAKHHALKLVKPFFKSLLTSGGMDGFFGAVLKQENLI